MDFKNFAFGTVATAPSPDTSGTSLILQTGEGAKFPAVFPYNIVIWPSTGNPTDSNAEIVKVTAKSTDTLTIVRAQEGTTARAVIAGDRVMFAITAEMLRMIEGHWSILQSNYGLSSSNSAQNAFPSGQDSLTLEADTLYEIKIIFDIRTGTTSHSTGLLFAGTATIDWILLNVRGFKGGVNATVTATNGSSKSNLTNYAQTPANATANTGMIAMGTFKCSVAGTFIPQIQFSSAPGGTNEMATGSRIMVRKIAKGDATVIGGWN